MTPINTYQLPKVRIVRFYPYFRKVPHELMHGKLSKTALYPHYPHYFESLLATASLREQRA